MINGGYHGNDTSAGVHLKCADFWISECLNVCLVSPVSKAASVLQYDAVTQLVLASKTRPVSYLSIDCLTGDLMPPYKEPTQIVT